MPDYAIRRRLFCRYETLYARYDERQFIFRRFVISLFRRRRQICRMPSSMPLILRARCRADVFVTRDAADIAFSFHYFRFITLMLCARSAKDARQRRSARFHLLLLSSPCHFAIVFR